MRLHEHALRVLRPPLIRQSLLKTRLVEEPSSLLDHFPCIWPLFHFWYFLNRDCHFCEGARRHQGVACCLGTRVLLSETAHTGWESGDLSPPSDLTAYQPGMRRNELEGKTQDRGPELLFLVNAKWFSLPGSKTDNLKDLQNLKQAEILAELYIFTSVKKNSRRLIDRWVFH